MPVLIEPSAYLHPGPCLLLPIKNRKLVGKEIVLPEFASHKSNLMQAKINLFHIFWYMALVTDLGVKVLITLSNKPLLFKIASETVNF